MKNYNNYILESKSNFTKIYNFLLSDKFKDKTKLFLSKCKNEVDEYKEAGQIIKRAVSGEKLSSEDKKKVYEQLVDTLKIGSSATLFLLPFGSILIIALIKIGKKFGINFLPSSFKVNESLTVEDKQKYLDSAEFILRELDYFLENGGDINMQDKDGNTALMFACAYNTNDIHFLLEYGADPNIIDNNGSNCGFDLLNNCGFDSDETIKYNFNLLLEYGLDLCLSMDETLYNHILKYFKDLKLLDNLSIDKKHECKKQNQIKKFKI